jgi:hypothetical protein
MKRRTLGWDAEPKIKPASRLRSARAAHIVVASQEGGRADPSQHDDGVAMGRRVGATGSVVHRVVGVPARAGFRR